MQYTRSKHKALCTMHFLFYCYFILCYLFFFFSMDFESEIKSKCVCVCVCVKSPRWQSARRWVAAAAVAAGADMIAVVAADSYWRIGCVLASITVALFSLATTTRARKPRKLTSKLNNYWGSHRSIAGSWLLLRTVPGHAMMMWHSAMKLWRQMWHHQPAWRRLRRHRWQSSAVYYLKFALEYICWETVYLAVVPLSKWVSDLM